MSKRNLAALLSAIVVVAIVTYVLVASIGGGTSQTMPNGQMTDGTMGNMTHTMSGGRSMDGPTMTTTP